MTHDSPVSIDLTAVDPQDSAASRQFQYEAVGVADRVNQALGAEALSPAARANETLDLHALQQLALLYAEHALDKTDWINLHRYVAQLAVAEGAQSEWRWQAMDLMSFALSDYLADRPDAGDGLLHEIVVLTRHEAIDWVHDAYRRLPINLCDDLRPGPSDSDAIHMLCQGVIAKRSKRVSGGQA